MRRAPRSQRTTISKATRRGNLAWTSGAFHGTVKQKDGTTMNLVGRHTAIWAKRGAKWIIVHRPRFSSPPDKPQVPKAWPI